MRLTDKERRLAYIVLERVIGNMAFDDQDGTYKEQSEDWRLSMDAATFAALETTAAKLKPAM